MACALCLKPLPKNQNLYTKLADLDEHDTLRQILELYFRPQSKYFDIPACGICRACVRTVNSFHNFFNRVQQGYFKLTEDAVLQLIQGENKKNENAQTTYPITSTSGITEIIVEPSIQLQVIKNESEETPAIPTRRGRSRLKVPLMAHENLPLAEAEIVQPLNMDTVKDETEVPTDVEKSELKRVGRRRRNVPAIENDLQIADAKVDELPGVENIAKDDNNVSVVDSAKPIRKRGRPRKNDISAGKKIKKSQPLKKKSKAMQQVAVMDADTNDNEKGTTEHSTNTKSDKMRNADAFIAANFKLSCCICESPLENFTALKRHFRMEHQTRGYVVCCRKKLLKRGLLVDHLQTHKNPNYFKCEKCGKVMVNRQGLELHMKNHVASRERIFTCNICSKSFFRRPVYQHHMLIHVPEDKRTEVCTKCNKSFATIPLLNQHIRLVHLKVDAKICDICGKSIRGREAFRRHQEEHAGIKSSRAICATCGSSYSNKYRLKYHIKMMHNEENLKPQICPICSKVSVNALSHKRHMVYTHSMERKHVCKLCGKGFKKSYTLREHMTTHTGEVLYTCPHCPKTFNSRANMHSHRKKAHRKEWEEARVQRAKKNQLAKAEENSLGNELTDEL